MHGIARVAGRKDRGPQAEEINCKCQTFFFFFLSLTGQKETNHKCQIFSPLLYTKLKGYFLNFCVATTTPGSTRTFLKP